jgi:VWFA-related protein
MRNKPFLGPIVLILGLSLGFGVFYLSALAQSAEREKPKLKNFGSSLKQIKWDANKNAAIETRTKNEKRTNRDEDVVRVDTNLVVTDLLVLDKQGRPVQALTRDDFVVTEDGKPQQVGSFSLGDSATVPRSIVLIFDYSCGQTPYLEATIGAAKSLVDKLGPRDRMAIVTDDVELLVDFTRDKNKLKDKLEFLKTKAYSRWFPSLPEMPWGRGTGRGLTYSALMATLKEAFDEEDERPIIILQTDGSQLSMLRNTPVTVSVPPGLPPDLLRQQQKYIQQFARNQRNHLTEFSLDDVYTAAQKSRATIYSVIPAFRLLGLPPEKQVAQTRAEYLKILSFIPGGKSRALDFLKRTPDEAWKDTTEVGFKMQSALARLATITGGWTEFLEDTSQATEIYSRIFSDINRRYVIGYYPTNKQHDGQRRKINIEVKGHPEYALMGRKSYYAPGAEQ